MCLCFSLSRSFFLSFFSRFRGWAQQSIQYLEFTLSFWWQNRISSICLAFLNAAHTHTHTARIDECSNVYVWYWVDSVIISKTDFRLAHFFSNRHFFFLSFICLSFISSRIFVGRVVGMYRNAILRCWSVFNLYGSIIETEAARVARYFALIMITRIFSLPILNGSINTQQTSTNIVLSYRHKRTHTLVTLPNISIK